LPSFTARESGRRLLSDILPSPRPCYTHLMTHVARMRRRTSVEFRRSRGVLLAPACACVRAGFSQQSPRSTSHCLVAFPPTCFLGPTRPHLSGKCSGIIFQFSEHGVENSACYFGILPEITGGTGGRHTQKDTLFGLARENFAQGYVKLAPRIGSSCDGEFPWPHP
jgi:hypothetical protein